MNDVDGLDKRPDSLKGRVSTTCCSRRCSPKNSAPSSRSAAPTAAASPNAACRWPQLPLRRRAQRPRRAALLAQRQACSARPAPSCNAGGRDQLPDRPPARRRRVRQGRIRGPADVADPACRWRWASIRPTIAAPFIATGARPKIAILREQGVNSQAEMAAAFDRAPASRPSTCTCPTSGPAASSADFKGLAPAAVSPTATCWGGQGWAKSILFNPSAREQFEAFFNRADTFALGVCNGCQMMSNLPRSSPAPTAGRASSATAASSSRPAS